MKLEKKLKKQKNYESQPRLNCHTHNLSHEIRITLLKKNTKLNFQPIMCRRIKKKSIKKRIKNNSSQLGLTY
jgi:hypothetical protein